MTTEQHRSWIVGADAGARDVRDGRSGTGRRHRPLRAAQAVALERPPFRPRLWRSHHETSDDRRGCRRREGRALRRRTGRGCPRVSRTFHPPSTRGASPRMRCAVSPIPTSDIHVPRSARTARARSRSGSGRSSRLAGGRDSTRRGSPPSSRSGWPQRRESRSGAGRYPPSKTRKRTDWPRSGATTSPASPLVRWAHTSTSPFQEEVAATLEQLTRRGGGVLEDLT